MCVQSARELAALEDLDQGTCERQDSSWKGRVTLSVEYPTGSSRNFILDEEVALQAFEAMKRNYQKAGHRQRHRACRICYSQFRTFSGSKSLLATLSPVARSRWPWIAPWTVLEMRRLEGDRLGADLLHRIVETEQLTCGYNCPVHRFSTITGSDVRGLRRYQKA